MESVRIVVLDTRHWRPPRVESGHPPLLPKPGPPGPPGPGHRNLSVFHGNLVVGAGSDFEQNRSQTGAGTGARGAFEGGQVDAEHAAPAVADADLDFGSAVGADYGKALADEGLVERVTGVTPGFAGLAHEGGDSAAGGVRQEVGVLLVEPADRLDDVLARDGAAFDQADPLLFEQRAEDRDESLSWLELLERRPLFLDR